MDLAGMKRRELQALCKRHGLPAGGSNAGLVARLDAALSGAADAEEEEVAGVPAKGCLKQTGGDAAEAMKVTFASEEGKARRLRSRVIWSPIVDKAKTRGKSTQASTNSAAAAEGGISAEVGANVPVRRSRRNSLSAALAEEVGEAVAVDRKRKRKNQENDKGVAVKKVTFAAEEGRARRLRSRVIWSPIVDKAKTRGKSAQASTNSAAAAEDSISAEVGANVPVRWSRRNSVSAALAEELGEAVAVDRKRKRKNQDNDESVAVNAQVVVSSRVTRRSSLAVAAAVLPPAVEKKRGRGKAAGDVQKSAQVEVPARITRSHAIAPAVISPIVLENKRRKTGDAQANVELPTVSDVPRNEAPVTRSLRSRVVQVNNSMVDETHTASQLESKTQPSKPPTRRHQQVSSSVEDKNQEQVAAPNKAPVLRRSGRNYSEDAEKQPAVKEPVKRTTRKSVVLATLEKEENDLIEEKNPAAHVRRSTRKSIVPVKDIKGIGEKIHNAKREDAVKQPATKGPVRGSRRKSVVPELHEKEKGLIAEKNMEAHEGKSKRKPVMPVKDIKAAEGIQNAKGKDVEKQVVVKQPTRRSSRKSVLPDMLENNSGLLAAEMNAEMNVRRSTRKSVLPNINEENQDHNKMANEKDDTRGRSSKRRRTTASEEVRSVKEANDDIIMRGATMDAHKATHEYRESGSRVQESGQVNVTRDEHSSGPWLVTATLPDKISTAQSVSVVIPGSESGDNSNESSDKSKQELPNIQTVDSHLSEKSAELDQSSCIAGLVLHNFDVSEDKSLMSKDGLSIDFTVGDREEQSPADMGKYPSRCSKGNPLSTNLHVEGAADDTSLPALNADKGCSSDGRPSSFGLELMFAEACKESYSKNVENTVGDREEQSPVSGEGRVGLEANASESGEKNPADIMSTGLYAKSLQHDTDIIAEETDKVAEESIRAADLGKCPSRCSKGKPLSTNLHVEGAADNTSLPALNADKGCSSDRRPSSFGLELMFAEACKESYSKNVEDTVGDREEQSPVSGEGRVGLEANASESGGKNPADIMSSVLYAKSLQHDTGIIAEETDKEECEESYSRNAENNAVEIDGGSKPSTPVTSGFHVQSYCLEDEDVQPTECDADKKPDVDEGVAEDFAQEKSNDQYVPAKNDLNMKLNDELAGPGAECITEMNAKLVADNLDEQAIILVQQGDVQEGDLEKPSPCSTTRVCKHKFGLLEETILPPKNTGSLSGSEQSPFGLQSLFSHENIDESMGSATAYTKNGFDDSKDCHVKSGLENTHVLEPYSNDDTGEGISKNDNCMRTSQQDNGIEGSPEANLDEERVLSVFSLDAKHIKEAINFEEVACEGERSKMFVHSEELEASSEKTNVNGPDGNPYGITDPGEERSNLKDGQFNFKLEGAKVVESRLYFSKDIGNILDSGSVVGKISPSGSGLSKDSSKEYRQEVLDGFSMQTSLDGSSTCGEKFFCRVDAIENEGPLSEEAVCTMKNYAGTCSSNPRDLLMELQSLFSKGNTKESDPHENLAFPSAENSRDESINVEQRVKLHHSSDLSHLDELIGCSNTEMLHQGHNHKDRSNVDRVEQVASEPCTNDIVKAAATAKCIESGLVLPPSEERSNLNDDQLNPKLESLNIIVSGLNCDKDVCNTSDKGSTVVVVGEKTPSGPGLPEDYPKDHSPQHELLDGFSVESSLQVTTIGKTIVSGVAAIGNPSSSTATPGTSSVDPRHLVMDLQVLFSEGSTEKSDLQDNLAFASAESGKDERIICNVDTHVSSEPDPYNGPCQDLSKHEEKEMCVSVPMQVKESGGFLRSSHIDLADGAHLIERDIAAAVEVLCEEKVERESMPISDSDILQEKSYSNGHGICQSRSQKHIVEANSRLFSCGTKVLHQDHKEECNEPSEGKFSPKAFVENNMTEDAPIEGIESSIMLPLVVGTSEIPDEQLNTKTSDESEELSISCDKDTIENFCTGPAKGDMYSLPKDFHIDSCQEQEVPEVLSLPKSPEESAKFQCVSVSGSGPCQQHVNESTCMQVTYNIDETVNQDRDEYDQNNEDQTTPGVLASSVPESVEIEIEQSEMEIGLIPATETSVLPVPDEQPNSKLEGNGDQITPGILTSSEPEAVEIEHSEMEIGLIPAVETSVLPVPDEQPTSKLEGNEVDEHSCSYDKDFFILPDSESLKREASSLHKDDCTSEDNHPNDLPAPRSPEPSACFQNDNGSGSVGICRSSGQSGIAELRAKLQSSKVSSTVKGSYIAMSDPRPKPGDSMSQSAIALLRNIENTPAVKVGHPVKPNADGKDSSRRALQPISGRPREH